MSKFDFFAWGAAAGYIVAQIQTLVTQIRKARKDAAAKVSEAKFRRDGAVPGPRIAVDAALVFGRQLTEQERRQLQAWLRQAGTR